MHDVVIYHKNCLDGECAAAIARDALSSAHPITGDHYPEMVAMHYGDDLPNVEWGDIGDVLIVDFSLPPDELRRVAGLIEGAVVTIDHHASAIRKYDGFAIPPNAHFTFDTSMSGAMLTWRHFHGDAAPPPLAVRLVQDRDLWQWKLRDQSEPFTEAMSALEDRGWDDWRDMLTDTKCVDEAIRNGYGIIAGRNTSLNKLVRDETFVMHGYISGVPAVAVNHFTWVSECGHKLLKVYSDVQVALMFTQRSDGDILCSLRARNGGVDVAKIAEEYGGGGHPAAAGFRIHKTLFDRVFVQRET